MELYASGLNAWGQLSLENCSGDVNVSDVHEFTCVLRCGTIKQIQAFLSHILGKPSRILVDEHHVKSLTLCGLAVTCDSPPHVAGHIPRDHLNLLEKDPQTYSTLAEAANGSVVRDSTPQPLLSLTEQHLTSHLQAIIDTLGAVHQLSSIHNIIGGAPGRIFQGLPLCTRVVAYDTGFAALTSTGSVYTWGDERYGSCLGRELSEDEPADRPGLVAALQDLPTGPITKIAAGGYMLATLTAGNDLYLWGGHPGKKTVPADITDEPTPVVIDEKDIADVAVGEAHFIVLTTTGSVYVIGDNGNGQVGLPASSLDSWSQVDLKLQGGRRAVGVAAGPRNSFIVVKTHEAP